eukprot:749573-Hanusia_phi.AAC.1
MAELQYTLPPPSDNHLSWWHLLLSYDLHTLRLFVNGSLAAQAQACPAPLDPLRGCGRILYPSSLDPQFKGPASFTVGGYEDGNMRISRSHQGMLKRIRLFAEALRLDVIRAAAQQMTLGAAVTPCSSGTFGVFAGMSPCSPCLAGTFNPLVGQVTVWQGLAPLLLVLVTATPPPFPPCTSSFSSSLFTNSSAGDLPSLPPGILLGGGWGDDLQSLSGRQHNSFSRREECLGVCGAQSLCPASLRHQSDLHA